MQPEGEDIIHFAEPERGTGLDGGTDIGLQVTHPQPCQDLGQGEAYRFSIDMGIKVGIEGIVLSGYRIEFIYLCFWVEEYYDVFINFPLYVRYDVVEGNNGSGGFCTATQRS